MFNKNWWPFSKNKAKTAPVVSVQGVISRAQHAISRRLISENALKVLYRLHKAGYAAYLVGGSVRDLLLQRTPKDFDVATDASPEQVRQLFRNSRLIGRRFVLVHVYYPDDIVEVSTFRAATDEHVKHTDPSAPLIASVLAKPDNTYGTIEEDSWRRDFTVNALYYNIADFSVVDHVGGMQDLSQHLIRVLGDPKQRFHEDPVRLLRAIRLAAKLNFSLAPDTEAVLLQLPHLLKHVPMARLLDETMKLFFEGNAWVTYLALQKYKFLNALFPETALAIEKDPQSRTIVDLAMQVTDERFAAQKSLNPGFLFAVLLWPVFRAELKRQMKKAPFFVTLHRSMDVVIAEQNAIFILPKRMIHMMRAIWVLQYHLERRRPARVLAALEQRYFRAGFDFLALRAKAGEPLQKLVDWWQAFQTADAKEREQLIAKINS